MNISKAINSPTYTRLLKLESTLDGADRTFMVIQYAAGLIGGMGSRGKLPLSLDAIKKLLTVSDKLSEWRTVSRFLGLLDMAKWGASLSRSSHWTEWARWASLTAFYPFEHVAYLASIGTITLSPQRLTKLYIWSVRLWTIYVVLEISRLTQQLGIVPKALRSLGLMAPAKKGAAKEKSDDGKAVSMSMVEKQAAKSGLNTQLAYLPMTAHWGVAGGVLPPFWAELLPLLAAYWGIRKSWLLCR